MSSHHTIALIPLQEIFEILDFLQNVYDTHTDRRIEDDKRKAEIAKRRVIKRSKDKPTYQRWKKVKSSTTCDTCTICGEMFQDEDQVSEGAPKNYYHRAELQKWVRQPDNSIVKDPNTGIVLETEILPVRKRRRQNS